VRRDTGEGGRRSEGGWEREYVAGTQGDLNLHHSHHLLTPRLVLHRLHLSSPGIVGGARWERRVRRLRAMPLVTRLIRRWLAPGGLLHMHVYLSVCICVWVYMVMYGTGRACSICACICVCICMGLGWYFFSFPALTSRTPLEVTKTLSFPQRVSAEESSASCQRAL
jgi:hypothetical protein